MFPVLDFIHSKNWRKVHGLCEGDKNVFPVVGAGAKMI